MRNIWMDVSINKSALRLMQSSSDKTPPVTACLRHSRVTVGRATSSLTTLIIFVGERSGVPFKVSRSSKQCAARCAIALSYIENEAENDSTSWRLLTLKRLFAIAARSSYETNGIAEVFLSQYCLVYHWNRQYVSSSSSISKTSTNAKPLIARAPRLVLRFAADVTFQAELGRKSTWSFPAR